MLRRAIRALVVVAMLAASFAGYAVLYLQHLPINALVVLVFGNAATQMFVALTGRYGQERRWAWRNVGTYRAYRRAGAPTAADALRAVKTGLVANDVRLLCKVDIPLSRATSYLEQDRFGRAVLLRFLQVASANVPSWRDDVDLDKVSDADLRRLTVFIQSGFSIREAETLHAAHVPISLALRPNERSYATLVLPNFWKTCTDLGIGESEAHHWLDVMFAQDTRVLDPQVALAYRDAAGEQGWLWAAAGKRPEEAYQAVRSGGISESVLAGLALKRGISTQEPLLSTPLLAGLSMAETVRDEDIVFEDSIPTTLAQPVPAR